MDMCWKVGIGRVVTVRVTGTLSLGKGLDKYGRADASLAKDRMVLGLRTELGAAPC